MLGDLRTNWWAVAVRGVLAVMFGLLAFFIPAITFVALVLLFGAYALADGFLAVIAAVRRQGDPPWWALALRGITGIAAGVVTIFMPTLTAIALVFVIAAWAITTGILDIVAAIRLRKYIEGEWLLALTGLLSLLFGVALAAAPGAGALAVLWIIALYAIALGVLLIVLGLRLRSHARRAEWRLMEASLRT